jgi:4-hydroxy-tetrahydrodipicolinate reductase
MTYEPGVVVVGAKGRMGQRICALLEAQGDAVAAQVDRDGPGLDDALGVASRCVIDFSTLEQVAPTVEFCVRHKVALVLGTTGLTPEHEDAINRAAKHVPVISSPNFSVGAHVLMSLVTTAARLLDEGWDAELVETHHRNKVDAPSGTALALAQRVAAARHAGLFEIGRYGRHGQVGARPRGELGVHAVRGGSIVGDHRLSFFGEGEVVTLEHKALDRDIFARGAVRAATWLMSEARPAGRYGLGDVLRRD